MVKKKVTSKKIKKKIIKKKAVLKKKSKSVKIAKKTSVQSNPLELIFKENENQLISLITKEYDKDLASKAKSYIKSYSKIEDSLITINDFLNYLKHILQPLAQNHLRLLKSQKRRKNQLVLKAMILSGCILKKWVMLSYSPEKVK